MAGSKTLRQLVGAFLIVLSGLLPQATGAIAAVLPWREAAQPLFQTYSQDNGLSLEFVTALTQDSDGFLWLGTAGGLVRYDGYRFKIYQATMTAASTLPDNYITALQIDGAGRLWVAVAAGNLARYDSVEDRFIPVAGGPTGGILSLEGDGEQGLWVGSQQGLDHYNPGKEVWTHIPLPGEEGQTGSRVRAIRRDGHGGLWLGTAAGLVYRPPGDVDDFRKVALPGDSAEVTANGVGALMVADDGRIWVGTDQHGVAVLTPDAAGSYAPDRHLAGLARFNQTWVRALVEVRPGQVWIGTQGSGIYQVDVATGQIDSIRRNALISTSLVNNNIAALFRDRSGLIWVGTYLGLSRFDPSTTGVRSLFTAAALRPDEVIDRSVHAVAVAPDGRLWIGHNENGLEILDTDGHKIAHLRPDARDPAGSLPQKAVRSIAFDRTGTAWIGTRQGLYRADLDGSRLALVPLTSDVHVDIKDILCDGDEVLIATYNDGLIIYNTVSKLASSYKFSVDGQVKLIKKIFKAPDGSYVLGTQSGVVTFDRKNGTFTPLDIHVEGTQNRLTGDAVTLLMDRRQRLWIAYYGLGLAVATQPGIHDSLTVKLITPQSGLPAATVNATVADADGAIWVSTDSGLLRVDPDTLALHVLQKADGVWIRDYWSNSATVAPDGEVLFGADEGLTAIQPALIRDWGYLPPLVITEAYIGDRLVSGGSIMRHPSTALVVRPEDKSLRVEVAALDFSTPEHNRYAYKLEGLDGNWTQTDANWRQITYNDLVPGHYRLRIRGSNRVGAWSPTELSFPIDVLPAWYQTWWCQSLKAGGVLLLFLLLLRMRTSLLRRRQRELEILVQQRTGELITLAATLRRLGDAGQEITATLINGSVFDTLHRFVAELLRARNLSLYRVQAESIDLVASDGETDRLSIPRDDAHAIVAKAAATLQDVKRPMGEGEAVAVPLVIDSQALGVLLVHLDRPCADREEMILRNLCAYGAVALENAAAYHRAESAWVETAQALTDLQAAQARLVQQEKMASLGRLVAGVAHEVNTPLGVVLTAAGTLRSDLHDLQARVSDGKLTRSTLERGMAEWSDLADLVERNTKRAASLIKSFSSVAVKEEGDDRVAELDLASFLTDVIRVTSKGLDTALIKIDLDVSYGLTVRSLPDALMEIFALVMDNIANHAFPPGRSGHVQVTAREEAGQIVIRIADNGQGIAPDVLPFVCDPFFTTARGQGHPGLGLHVAYNHATQRMGGTFTVDSQPGAGTLITLTIPAN